MIAGEHNKSGGPSWTLDADYLFIKAKFIFYIIIFVVVLLLIIIIIVIIQDPLRGRARHAGPPRRADAGRRPWRAAALRAGDGRGCGGAHGGGVGGVCGAGAAAPVRDARRARAVPISVCVRARAGLDRMRQYETLAEL